MIEGKTNTGFLFSIEEEALDDMEILENLAALSEGHIEVVPKTIVMILGEEQKEKLYEHCRGENGRVSSKRIIDELKSVFEASKEVKN